MDIEKLPKRLHVVMAV